MNNSVPSPPQSLMDRIRFLEDHVVKLERDYPPWAALHFNQPNRGVRPIYSLLASTCPYSQTYASSHITVATPTARHTHHRPFPPHILLRTSTLRFHTFLVLAHTAYTLAQTHIQITPRLAVHIRPVLSKVLEFWRGCECGFGCGERDNVERGHEHRDGHRQGTRQIESASGGDGEVGGAAGDGGFGYVGACGCGGVSVPDGPEWVGRAGRC